MRGIGGVWLSLCHRIFVIAQLGAPANQTVSSILLIIAFLVWRFILVTCLFTYTTVGVSVIRTLSFK